MSSKSKTKGSGFEREVANFLSELYSEPFVRVPNSGAYIGKSNTHRKNFLDDNQVKSFKGDIIPPDSWTNFNAEAKNYADFPFHLVLSGECKVLDGWLQQLMAVADDGDLNILLMKISRKGRYIAVQAKNTWVTDQFLYYSSKTLGDWLIIEFDQFFMHNKDLLKAYTSPRANSTSNSTTDTQS